MNIFKASLITFCSLLLFSACPAIALTEAKAPIILEVAQIKGVNGDRLRINGLVEPGKNILVYINKKYFGLANITETGANFNTYAYTSPILKAENFTAMVIARDENSFELSPSTERETSSIVLQTSINNQQEKAKQILKDNSSEKKEEIPAPTLTSPKTNISEYKPFISGFSKNDTRVSVYIDNILDNELWATNSASGTASFSYPLKNELKRGNHFIYAIASDKNGNKSLPSNILYFSISDPQITATNTEDVIASNSPAITPPSSTPALQTEKPETKKGFNKNVNLTLFLLFVGGIIFWIILVNKDLRKNDLQEEKEELPKIKDDSVK